MKRRREMAVPAKRGAEGGAVMSFREEIDRLFEDFLGGLRPVFGRGEWMPAIDVSETDKEVVIKAELPGMDGENVDVAITGDVLTIKGEKKEETTKEGENYSRMERRYGAFHRAVTLPMAVDPNKVNATFKNGVLRVTLEKKEESKPRAIKVETK
jgi:HSP20 family protein